MPGVSWTQWDVVNRPVVFPRGTDAVFYLSQSPYYREFPQRAEHLLAVNVMGAVKAARAAVEAGARFFCYASTGNVYRPSFDPLAEDAPLRRDNGYALSKVMAEEALSLVHDSMALVSVRLFGVFGPGQRGMLVPNIRERVRNQQPIRLDGSPRHPGDDGLRVSLCCIDDTVDCLVRLMQLACGGSPVPKQFNIAGPEPISIRRLAVEQGKLLQVEPKFERGEQVREFDLIADISRLRQFLNPTFSDFGESLARTLESDRPAQI